MKIHSNQLPVSLVAVLRDIVANPDTYSARVSLAAADLISMIEKEEVNVFRVSAYTVEALQIGCLYCLARQGIVTIVGLLAFGAAFARLNVSNSVLVLVGGIVGLLIAVAFGWAQNTAAAFRLLRSVRELVDVRPSLT